MTEVMDYSKLRLQFSDDFKEVGSLDPDKWAKLEHADLDLWTGNEGLPDGGRREWQEGYHMNIGSTGEGPAQQVDVRCEGGCAIVRATTTMPPGPLVMAYGGFYTRERQFNQGLSGTNIFEATLVDYTPGGEYLNKWPTGHCFPRDVEDPAYGRYLMGWGLTIASIPGAIGKEDKAKDRVVQFHFDWLSEWGLGAFITRTLLPDDLEKYPELNPETNTHEGMPQPYIGMPSLVLRLRMHPTGKADNPVAHRCGLGLTNNGNTVFWTLDGQVMDSADITGFFQSAPEGVEDGAYASIFMGGSHQSNVWKVADAKIYVSKASQ